jgi:hypothetical protein
VEFRKLTELETHCADMSRSTTSQKEVLWGKEPERVLHVLQPVGNAQVASLVRLVRSVPLNASIQKLPEAREQ